MDWFPKGQSIFYVVGGRTETALWLLPLTTDGKGTRLTDSKFPENFPQISPDGKWLAYASQESGAEQIYVRAFPNGNGKWQVSMGARGGFPRWRSDGKELFYATDPSQGKLMSRHGERIGIQLRRQRTCGAVRTRHLWRRADSTSEIISVMRSRPMVSVFCGLSPLPAQRDRQLLTWC